VVIEVGSINSIYDERVFNKRRSCYYKDTIARKTVQLSRENFILQNKCFHQEPNLVVNRLRVVGEGSEVCKVCKLG
jgi:hypothetical protein